MIKEGTILRFDEKYFKITLCGIFGGYFVAEVKKDKSGKFKKIGKSEIFVSAETAEKGEKCL